MSTPEGPVVRASGLRKSFGQKVALDGLDLEVGAGEIVAILGPNGAGKTTLMSVMEGLLARDGGEVEVLGVDPGTAGSEWRERIGIVLQETAIEPLLTVRESLELYSGYYRDPYPVEEVIELVGLGDSDGVRAGRLSGGQRRRLDVGIAMCGAPELLFLDEPTTGFDPAARRRAWEMIGGLREVGKTILLTTHYLEEAQFLADRISILNAGRVIAEGRPDDLGGTERNRTVISFRLDGAIGSGLPDGLTGRSEHDSDRELISIASADPARDLAVLLPWAREQGIDLASLEVKRPSLEDIYLELIG